jgi:MFS transporter, UMF1 family
MACTDRRPLLYTSAAMKEQGQKEGPEARRRGPENGTAHKASGLAVWSWVLYDFSNTIFSISILSYFFPLWLGDELGAGADTFNYLVSLSALLVVLTAPVLGSVADLTQRRRPYLVVLTILAVILTAGLSFSGGTLLMVAALFVAADVCYQSALVFYNALLPVVSAGRGAGRISGYGTAAGYVGTIFALVTLTLFVAEQSLFGVTFGGPEAAQDLLGPLGGWIDTSEEPNSNAFLPTAVLYLLLSLPAFLFVSDKAIREPRPVHLATAYKGLFTAVGNMRAYAGLGTFMIATVLYTDAANTAIANMSLYGRQVFGMEQTQIQTLLLFSAVFAGVGSVGFGFASDRIGPKKTLVLVLVLWLVSIVIATLAFAPWMLLLAGPLVGAALGGTWTVSRTMLLALSPPERTGEFFGVYALAGKLSAVAGPATTAVILTTLEGYGNVSYRIAIGSLALILGLGLFLLLRVPDARYEETIEEFSPEVASGAHRAGE